MRTSVWWLGLALCLLVHPLLILNAGPLASSAGALSAVLEWHDFFQLPIGPRGLEPTAKLLRLQDQRVCVRGYLIKETEPLPGLCMLAPTPVTVTELADGPADYLPATTLFVHWRSADPGLIRTYRPGLWTVSGVLQLGAHQEPNGRRSYVRVLLDDLQSLRPTDHQSPTCRDEDARHPQQQP